MVNVHVAVVGALARHVDHVLDAVDLFFDRCGHRLGNCLGVGTCVTAAFTVTVGGAISGYCAIGSVKIAIAPTMIVTIDRTPAKTGRSIKK